MSPPARETKKPTKPYPDYPLFPHDNGQWAKKIRGKLRFFGTWKDPQAAVDLYDLQREALYAGRTPPTPGESALRVVDICNAFLLAKQSLWHSGDLSRRTLDDYSKTCEGLTKAFGTDRTIGSLLPADFDAHRESLSKRLGPVALGNEIVRVRSVFHYAYEAGLLEVPIRFGPHFKRPSAKAIRLAKDEAGQRLFTSEELQAVLAVAKQPMHTIILLGLNCGLGNADIGRLETRHLDLTGRWLNFPRPKTGIARRARLWPETVTGLRKILAARRQPLNEADAGLVFLTKYGRSWHKTTRDSPITKELTKLLTEAKLVRPGLNFYALRHTFQTIGEECGDQSAVRAVMGHAPHLRDMSAVYREKISDERLMRLANFVRSWAFRKSKKSKKVS